MIPANRAYLPVAVALVVGYVVGLLGDFEPIATLGGLLLLIAHFVICAYVDAGKAKAADGRDV